MKTKILLTAMFFASITYSAFAQFEKEKEYKWNIAIGINSTEAQMDEKLLDTWVLPIANYYGYFGDKNNRSISFSFIPKYKITDNIHLRLEFGITNIDLRNHYNGKNNVFPNWTSFSSASNITKKVSIQQKIYRYAMGVQWSFMKKNFMESFCGGGLIYHSYTEMHWNDFVGDNSSPNLNNHSTWTSTTAGGYATGIGAIGGVNIYLYKNISIGGELFYSLQYYKLGGKQNGIYERGYDSGLIETAEWSIDNNRSKGIQFSKVMPSFNITMRF